MQDYLKAIHELQEAGEDPTPKVLAERLDVTPASASDMTQRLAELDLVEREPYEGVELTAAGELTALEVIRHHRLLELFLVETLGIPWDEVHEEAEVLEHHISEELEDRIAERLDHPERDPHGDPIPSRDGSLPNPDGRRLDEIEEGAEVRIVRVSDDDPDVLRFLGSRGLYPGAEARVEEADPGAAVLTVEVDGRQVHVGEPVARQITVEEVPA
ncbi:DtxR family transcriptional regulator [Thermoplasmatales archaeon SW_10_69_26]|nr:MAG: DtxR family transcriptional regulator [Thermoplasmatales archaeon SW_10_69_26]